MEYFILVPAAYLLGSIPTGLLLVRLLRGIDVREYGSGKTGVTNVLRTAGKAAAAVALVVDTGKGALAILLARLLLDTPLAETTAGILVIVGHNWPVFLRFKGGRGMATGMGVTAVLMPWAVVAGAVVFLPVVLLSRYVSLGSVAAVVAIMVAFAVATVAYDYPIAYLGFALIGGAILVLQHRDNIQRLLKGTEHRLGQPAQRRSPGGMSTEGG